jgi:hypothetical protein
MNYIPVQDKNHLKRDLTTNAIINTDHESYASYVETYKQKYNEKQRIQHLESEMETIKGDLSEIKSLILSLVKHES